MLNERDYYIETFRSPFEKETEKEALKVLQEIRNVHSSEHGWEELEGYIEELSNGKYRAVRKHAKKRSY